MTKLSETSSKQISEQPRIVYQNQQNKPKSRCSISRLICIQLLVLLTLLVLAAIIIPIVVIILDTTTSPCTRTYSAAFTSGVIPTTQCTDWVTFRVGLNCSSYSKMHIYGSNDPEGITVTDSTVVTALAIALRYNTTLVTVSNGVSWRVGTCGSGYEITTNGYCNCAQGYVLRPCLGSTNWGGINGQTCSTSGAVSQTMSITFE